MGAKDLNYQQLILLNITPSSTATYARIGAGISSVENGNNEELDQTRYLDGAGYAETDVTGAQKILVFSGHRDKDDAAQNYIFGLELELGDERKTDAKYYDKDGNLVSGDVTIANISGPGGDAGAKGAIGFELHFNGKPTKTLKSAATALTDTVGVGVAVGTTSWTATAGAGNTLAYKLASATVGTVYGNSLVTGQTAYTSGDDIPATAGQFLLMYELDAYSRVVKFLEAELASGDIKAAV